MKPMWKGVLVTMGCTIPMIVVASLILLPLWFHLADSVTTTELSFPFDELTVYRRSKHVHLTAAEGVRAQDLYDTAVYGDFNPETRLTEAVGLLGPIVRVWEEEPGFSTVFTFPESSLGTFELVRYPSLESEPDKNPKTFWYWRLSPADQSPESFFAPAVLAAIPPLDGDFKLLLRVGSSSASVWFKSGVIRYISVAGSSEPQ